MADTNEQTEYEIREELRKEEVRKIGEQIAQQLTNAVNANSEQLIAEGFIRGFIKNHRTLQQGAGRVLFMFIQDLANKYKTAAPKYTDLRNEGFYQFCADVIRNVPDHNFPRI